MFSPQYSIDALLAARLTDDIESRPSPQCKSDTNVALHKRTEPKDRSGSNERRKRLLDQGTIAGLLLPGLLTCLLHRGGTVIVCQLETLTVGPTAKRDA